VVLKVGGSLLDWPELPVRLAGWLEARRSSHPRERPVLIAGGGPAADLVRALDRVHHFGDTNAHELAIQALGLTARLLAAILPGGTPVDRLEDLASVWSDGGLPVLIPAPVLAEIEQPGQDCLPPSWDVTSDSIAARIAVHLDAEHFILLKSASLPAGARRDEASKSGWVDPMFPHVARALRYVAYLNLRDPTARLEVLGQAPSRRDHGGPGTGELDERTRLGQNPN
jgi:aspartokinase-like uncharacterized kinase